MQRSNRRQQQRLSTVNVPAQPSMQIPEKADGEGPVRKPKNDLLRPKQVQPNLSPNHIERRVVVLGKPLEQPGPRPAEVLDIRRLIMHQRARINLPAEAEQVEEKERHGRETFHPT